MSRVGPWSSRPRCAHPPVHCATLLHCLTATTSWMSDDLDKDLHTSQRLVAAADVEPDLVGPAVPSDSGDFIEDSAVLILDSVALNRIASFQVDADEASEDDELLSVSYTHLTLPTILRV